MKLMIVYLVMLSAEHWILIGRPSQTGLANPNKNNTIKGHIIICKTIIAKLYCTTFFYFKLPRGMQQVLIILGWAAV